MKLALDEDGSDVVRLLWDEPVRWVAPTIVIAEVAAAIAAARRAGRLSADGAVRAHRTWSSVSQEIDLIAVDVSLATRAGELAADRGLRGMDAVYLATALVLADAGQAGLLSFDRRQRDGVDTIDDIALMPAALPGAALPRPRA